MSAPTEQRERLAPVPELVQPLRPLQLPAPVAPLVLAGDAGRSGFGIRRPRVGMQVMPCAECGQMIGRTAMRWLTGPPMRIGCVGCALTVGSAR